MYWLIDYYFSGKDFNKSNLTSCENIHRSIDEFPKDFFTEEQRRHGAVIIHLILAFYGFLFITFVCQDYFLPSVLYICLGMTYVFVFLSVLSISILLS